VFNSNVKSFSDNSISDLLVDNDSDCSGVDVEDGSGSSVIIFIRHALMDGAITYNVDNISNFVGGEILGDVN
jgi:hypothetical protein